MGNGQDLSLQKLRCAYEPRQPALLDELTRVEWVPLSTPPQVSPNSSIQSLFPCTINQPFLRADKGPLQTDRKPLRLGVVFSGGPAPGGHNVIIGLHAALTKWHPDSVLVGFLNGPEGVVRGWLRPLDSEHLAPYRNQGGFDLLGSGRFKLDTVEHRHQAMRVLEEQHLDGLVVIGGDDSNTNAALLAEYLVSKGSSVRVIGVPKTIDGDIKNPYVDISFGFDTACKVYAELIGNIERDALSARKYYHFVRLMGRAASHITLECALATCPNLALIGEEIAARRQSLRAIVTQIAELISKRAKQGKHWGVILIPEGIIEFIPEMAELTKELSTLLAKRPQLRVEEIGPLLQESMQSLFLSLPAEIQQQLILDRDPHGNVRVSSIQSEILLETLVQDELRSSGVSFSSVHHFLGYEGRAAFPSNFDCNYCTALGQGAALLALSSKTGYMVAVSNLARPPEEWCLGALPLTALMTMEVRKAESKPVIEKALVDLKGRVFAEFMRRRLKWELEDRYEMPGPLQFFGPSELTDRAPLTLLLDLL
jgi:pyrophosphate--fructose-6-phosphate 1-phosphotransferase